MQTSDLNQNLQNRIHKILFELTALLDVESRLLNFKENPNSWSILECIQHLNLYGTYYLPLIEKKTNDSKNPFDNQYKSGFLGHFILEKIKLRSETSKMKALKNMIPNNSNLSKTEIETCIQQQHLLLELLKKSEHKNWNKIRIPTSISPLLRLKLGDTFQFLVYHMERHLNQIYRIKTNIT
ncbi:MAG: DinB family protein [Leadbetterella sp.]